ncbi:hypothetical protein [Streptomyces lydicus]|uniref:hypothetical protein n=1 Tax=Streptomyces lydicus TaxID=47763 RepID=UPI003F4E3727
MRARAHRRRRARPRPELPGPVVPGRRPLHGAGAPRVPDDGRALRHLNQVDELFTRYGPLDELWLHGANPWSDSGITQGTVLAGGLPHDSTDPDIGSRTAVRATYGTDLRTAGPGPWTFDRIGLGEDLRHGQRVERFEVAARTGGTWTTLARGTTVGHRRILALPAPVTADAVRVTVREARGRTYLTPVTLHRSRGAGG